MPVPGPRDPGVAFEGVEVRLAFPAMGSRFTLAVRARADQADAARRTLLAEMNWLREVERRLSRFEPDSELSRLNRRSGQWCVVSPLLYSALQAAARAFEMTAGLFDPSVLGTLEQWGYDRDFKQLRREVPHRRASARGQDEPPAPAGGSLRASPAVPGSGGGASAPFLLDPVVRAVRLAEGVRLDLGGIVKGLAADTVVARLSQRFPAALVDAGGDVAAAAAPGMPLWRIQLPLAAWHVPRVLRVRRGAVATSAVQRRWWGPRGLAHHLIDPRTQAPAASGVRLACVAARSAAEAEVLAKVLVIAGPETAAPLLRLRAPVEAWWELASGEVGTHRCRSG